MKHIIYDNYNCEVSDYEADFKEYCEINEITPDADGIYEFMNDSLYQWWDDEFRYTLDIDADSEIICIADLGFWYGRKSGYKMCGANVGHAIAESFSDDEDYREIYVEDGDVKGAGHHHDGTHYYTWRLIKKSASATDVQKLKDKIYNNEYYDDLLAKCTKSLAPTVNKVYGWKNK